MWHPSYEYTVGTTGNSVTLDELADPTFRLVADPDLAPGDVVTWTGLVQVFADGTFVADASVAAFEASVGGLAGLQTLAGVWIEPEPEPEPEPPPPEPEPEPAPPKRGKGKGRKK